MIPVIAGFVLMDYPQIQKFLDKYAGIDRDSGMRQYISLSSKVLASYFRGQFTVMLILCLLYTIVLEIVGLESAVLLGIFTGALSIVPYLGFSTGIVLSLLFAVVQFQDILHPVYVIIGYSAVQALESFIITPKIVGDSVGLRPIATMMVLLLSGAAFGLVGMIFALPITAILFKLYVKRKAQLSLNTERGA
jgi:predicted PurR-regulated permease PerM